MTTKELLRLIKSGRYEEERFQGTTLTIASRRIYSDRDEQNLNAFLEDIAARIGHKVAIIGGGHGCSITKIAIYSDDPKPVIALIDYLKCYDRDNTHVQNLSIDVFLLPQQKLEYYPRDGRLQNYPPMNQNIVIHGNVSDSNFSARDTKTSNQHLSDLIQHIQNTLGRDESLSVEEKTTAIESANLVRKEVESGSPKKEVVKPLLDTLSKLSSIANLVINFQRAIGVIP